LIKKNVSKVTASRIKWNPEDSTYTMYDYTKRTVGLLGDKIEKMPEKKTKFSFDLEDLTGNLYCRNLEFR
jgi:lipopolysaccharide export system permease protein